MNYIEVVYFDILVGKDEAEREVEKIEEVGRGVAIQEEYRFLGDRKVVKETTNNPVLFFKEKEEAEQFLGYLGRCDYTFRKGIGYVGEVYRLRFLEERSGRYVFQCFDKVKNRLVPSGRTLELSLQELEFIYPLVLSPDLKKDGFVWGCNYIIFPYRFGEKNPLSEEELKEIAPRLYNYLLKNRDRIEKQSKYNDRIQARKEFYSLIRVGKYCYGSYFVAFRDNTDLNACVVEHIKTDWGELKNPVFDGHVSYVGVSSKEEANYIASILRRKEVLELIHLLFDNRSISSRLPIRIPLWRGSHVE